MKNDKIIYFVEMYENAWFKQSWFIQYREERVCVSLIMVIE